MEDKELWVFQLRLPGVMLSRGLNRLLKGGIVVSIACAPVNKGKFVCLVLSCLVLGVGRKASRRRSLGLQEAHESGQN